VFEDGAILNGSKLVTDWTFNGIDWVATGQSQSIPPPKNLRCDIDRVQCEFEDLFKNDLPMRRVLSRAEVGSGQFYFDETNDKIYMKDSPIGQKVEATVAERLIVAGGVQNVTVRGATVEKCGRAGITTSSGWVVDRVELRHCHGIGLTVYGYGTRVTHVYTHHAGQMGMFGQGTNQLFDQIHSAYNNYLNFSFAKGGTKIIKSNGTVVRDSWIHDVNGGGWHFDWDNINFVFEGNLVERNPVGLLIEASFAGVVRNNVFRANGLTGGEPHYGAIFINTSKDQHVYNNTFVDNIVNTFALVWTDRGSSFLYGERQTSGLAFHDNIIAMRGPGMLVNVPYGTGQIYSASNGFHGDAYSVPDPSAALWKWKDGKVGWTKWRSYDFDTSGLLRRL